MNRRLQALEERIVVSEDELRKKALDEFYRHLTYEELDWLSEPGDEAQKLVPCPHVESIRCGCRGSERERRGFEAHPELWEEYLRRRKSLLDQAEEILEREPEDPAESWRRRYGISRGGER